MGDQPYFSEVQRENSERREQIWSTQGTGTDMEMARNTSGPPNVAFEVPQDRPELRERTEDGNNAYDRVSIDISEECHTGGEVADAALGGEQLVNGADGGTNNRSSSDNILLNTESGMVNRTSRSLVSTSGPLPVSELPTSSVSFRESPIAEDVDVVVVQDPDGQVTSIIMKGKVNASDSQNNTERSERFVRILQRQWTPDSTIFDLNDPYALRIFRIMCTVLIIDILYTLAIFVYTMVGTDPQDDSLKFDPTVPFLLPILSGRGLAFLLLGGTLLISIAAYLGGKQVRTGLLVFTMIAGAALTIVSAVDAFSLETLVKAAIVLLSYYFRRVLLNSAQLSGITFSQIVQVPRYRTPRPSIPLATVYVPSQQVQESVE